MKNKYILKDRKLTQFNYMNNGCTVTDQNCSINLHVFYPALEELMGLIFLFFIRCSQTTKQRQTRKNKLIQIGGGIIRAMATPVQSVLHPRIQLFKNA